MLLPRSYHCRHLVARSGPSAITTGVAWLNGKPSSSAGTPCNSQVKTEITVTANQAATVDITFGAAVDNPSAESWAVINRRGNHRRPAPLRAPAAR